MTRRAMMMLALIATAWAGPDTTHTGVFKTTHFELRFRPGSRAGAAVERDSAAAERDLARICAALEMKNDGTYRMFLYDDSAELQAITGAKGAGAFAHIRDVHLPFGDDQIRAHEIAHVVTYRLPKTGTEPRNMFFPDGIANALLVHVHGVHVHAVAKFYRMRKALPSLTEMVTVPDFYGWLAKRRGFNGYDVAASFLRYAWDTYGVAKLKRYYTGTPARDAFGKDVRALEKDWHRFLDAYELRPEVETLLRRKAGEAVRFDRYELDPFARLPKELRGKPSDWTDLTGARFVATNKKEWARTGGRLVGATKPATWTWCALGKKTFGNVVIAAVLRPAPGSVGVAVRLGPKLQALIVPNGTFLYSDGKPCAHTASENIAGRSEVHLVLVRRGDAFEVWVDGFRLLSGNVKSDRAVPSVGVAAGTVTVGSVRVRRLR